jgi:hypothetical protein
MTWLGMLSRTLRGQRFSAARVSAFCLVTSASVLPGCADLQWQKAGATAEALENDLAECRGEARRNAGPDLRLIQPDAGRIQGMDAASRPSASSGRLDGERFLVEHDLTRICMNRRGYELAPESRRGD